MIEKDVKDQEHARMLKVGHNLNEGVNESWHNLFLCNKGFSG